MSDPVLPKGFIICSKCFKPRKRASGTLCSTCQRAKWGKEHRKRHLDTLRERQRRFRQRNPERARQIVRDYRERLKQKGK